MFYFLTNSSKMIVVKKMIKIYGKNVVKEAFNAKRKIYSVKIVKAFSKSNKPFLDIMKKSGVKIEEVDSIDTKGKHQGIVAEVEDYKYYELSEVLEDKNQYFLILDGIVDPHNLGAIIRSADAAGFDGIIVPKNNSVSLNSTVAKVSVGAIEHVKVIMVNNLARCIDDLKKNKFWIVGTKMDAQKSYKDIDPSTSLAIIIGNEGSGIRRLVLDKCDYHISIPMVGKINSLNASVSAALIMYEVLNKK